MKCIGSAKYSIYATPGGIGIRCMPRVGTVVPAGTLPVLIYDGNDQVPIPDWTPNPFEPS